MELSKLSMERLEGVDERLKAIVIECAARCPYPAARICEAGQVTDDEQQAPHRKSCRPVPVDDESEAGGLVQVRGAGRPDVSGGQRPGHRNRLGWPLEDVRR